MMRGSFFADRSGVATRQMALVAGGLALASLIGIRVLETPLTASKQPLLAIEGQTDLERLARTIPAASGRSGVLSSGGIDLTSTATTPAKRSIQVACHGERTVSMIAPAGGNPIVLSTCGTAKSGRE
ncbi:MAG: hypothetical protein JOZ16_02445 [Methylobacteriaceae bacterium]|nr:hypothetical protein [Methylobacteriaceae bacterium]